MEEDTSMRIFDQRRPFGLGEKVLECLVVDLLYS